jgi:16S rRNA pseudouridine516 synthase
LSLIRHGEQPVTLVRIQEGKFHQMKKMFRAVDRTVLALRRIRIGELMLDPGLAPGEYREMNK